MAFTKGAANSSLAERRLKELLEKAQRRAAGLDTPGGGRAPLAPGNSSDSSSELDEDFKVVKVKPGRVKAPPSSSSENDSDEDDVKPQLSKLSKGAQAKKLPPLNTPVKRFPSSSDSESESQETQVKAQVTKVDEDSSRKLLLHDKGDTASDTKAAVKRKRNSILPRVVQNPWKRRVSERRESTSDEERPAKTLRQEVSFNLEQPSSSSNSENEEPVREPVKISPVKLPKKTASSSSDDSSSEDSDTDGKQAQAKDEEVDAEDPAPGKEDVTEETPNDDAEYFQPLGSSKPARKKAPVAIAVPKWVQRAVSVSTKVESQDDLDEAKPLLGHRLIASLKANGIQGLFPIQKEVISALLDARSIRQGCPPRDICVAAPTGSGKTLAFVLPLVRLLENRLERAVRALVLLPTTELAKQVFDVLSRYVKDTSVTAALLAGLKSHSDEEQTLLERGHSLVDVIVATPAKLVEHLRTTPGFSLRLLELLILDEADRMVDMIQYGLIQEIEDAVYQKPPEGQGSGLCRCDKITPWRVRPGVLSCCTFDSHHIPVRKLLYSATLMSDPEKLKHLNLFYPKVFHASHPRGRPLKSTPAIPSQEQQNSTLKPAPVHQMALVLPDKLEERWMACDLSTRPLLVWWLAVKKAHERMLVFTRTREECHRLKVVIEHLGNCRVVNLSADLKKRQRQKALQDFDNGVYDMLVCTAVLARGMDLTNVQHVVLYHTPHSAEEYVHTVGRTARANRDGVSIVLMNKQEERNLKKLLKPIANSRIKQKSWDANELKEYYERYDQALHLAKKQLQQHTRSVSR